MFVEPSKVVTRETILEKNELVAEILLPAAEAGLKSSYRKVRARGAWDFALAGIALALVMKGATVERARVVFSGVAPIPWRSQAVEQAITGRALTPEVAAAAAEAGIKGAVPLEKNAYKVPLLKGLITEALLALA
jgi:xanthine dehydrogenase YagS FAD-binding subunit